MNQVLKKVNFFCGYEIVVILLNDFLSFSSHLIDWILEQELRNKIFNNILKMYCITSSTR